MQIGVSYEIGNNCSLFQSHEILRGQSYTAIEVGLIQLIFYLNKINLYINRYSEFAPSHFFLW